MKNEKKKIFVHERNSNLIVFNSHVPNTKDNLQAYFGVLEEKLLGPCKFYFKTKHRAVFLYFVFTHRGLCGIGSPADLPSVNIMSVGGVSRLVFRA